MYAFNNSAINLKKNTDLSNLFILTLGIISAVSHKFNLIKRSFNN